MIGDRVEIQVMKDYFDGKVADPIAEGRTEPASVHGTHVELLQHRLSVARSLVGF